MYKYPQLVIRAMPAIYLSKPMRIFRGDPRFEFELSDSSVLVYYPETYDDDGVLLPEFKKFLISAVKGLVQRKRMYMCIVWAEKQTTYIEPDGHTFDSDFVPKSNMNEVL